MQENGIDKNKVMNKIVNHMILQGGEAFLLIEINMIGLTLEKYSCYELFRQNDNSTEHQLRILAKK